MISAFLRTFLKADRRAEGRTTIFVRNQLFLATVRKQLKGAGQQTYEFNHINSTELGEFNSNMPSIHYKRFEEENFRTEELGTGKSVNWRTVE